MTDKLDLNSPTDAGNQRHPSGSLPTWLNRTSSRSWLSSVAVAALFLVAAAALCVPAGVPAQSSDVVPSFEGGDRDAANVDQTFTVKRLEASSAGPYDGKWSGTTDQGKTISFTIVNNAVSVFTIGYLTNVGPCTREDSVTFTYSPPRPFSGSTFSIVETHVPGLSVQAVALFDSSTSASGGAVIYYASTTCQSQASVQWTATTSTPLTGFSGRVTDTATGSGISGASVAWGSSSTTTDGSGNYALNSLPCQTNTLTVSKSGYQTFSQTYTPACNSTNQKNVALSAAPTQPPGSFTLTGNAHCGTETVPPTPIVTLSWTASSGATSYDVYRDGALHASGWTDTLFQSVVDVTAGSTYTYFVQAINASGSTNSNTISVTVPTNVCTLSGRVWIGDQHALPGHAGLERTVAVLDAAGNTLAETPIQPDGTYTLALSADSRTISCSYSYLDYYASDTLLFDKRTAILTNPINKPDLYFPAPLVLIHGILTDRTRWSFWALWIDGHRKAQIYLAPNYDWLFGTYQTDAETLHTQLSPSFAGLATAIPGFRIIAHSKGGLAARAFSCIYRGDPIGGALRDVILLGTPNSGTDCYPSFFVDLDKCKVTELNDLCSGFGQATVHVVAGTKHVDRFIQSKLDPLKLKKCLDEHYPHDGAVPVDSVWRIRRSAAEPLELPWLLVPFSHTELGDVETLWLLRDVLLPYYDDLDTGRPAPFAPPCPPADPSAVGEGLDCDDPAPGEAALDGRGYHKVGGGYVCDAISPLGDAPSIRLAWQVQPAGPPVLVSVATGTHALDCCADQIEPASVELQQADAPLGFNIYRRSDEAPTADGENRIGTADASVTSFTDPFPAPGTNRYAVTADYESGESGLSNVLTVEVAGSGSCALSSRNLCLAGNRFSLNVHWRVPAQNREGDASGVALTEDTGYFWFFSPENLELVIKVLDARTVNGHFWVFYGALSNVEYTITVTDTVTGAVETYFNPTGHLASVADTSAFQGVTGGPQGVEAPTSPVSPEEIQARSAAELYGLYEVLTDAKLIRAADAAPCTAGGTTLCLNETRFQLTVDWSVPSQGRFGHGTAVPVTSDTGYFWFFNDTNVELVIKVLDARTVNGHFWVFYGALSNVKYTITVTDTQTGIVKTYANESGNLASVADTTAF